MSDNESTTGNPYQVNTMETSVLGTSGALGLTPDTRRGLVGHVQIVGVLMIVQGLLDVVMALGIGAYSIFLPRIFAEIEAQAAEQGQQGNPMPENFETMFLVGGSILAVLILCVALLMVFAGWQAIQFRLRVWGIVALCSGMLSALTCYCLPTSLALAVYGLIVFLNPSVMLAFGLREQGFDANAIRYAFGNLPK